MIYTSHYSRSFHTIEEALKFMIGQPLLSSKEARIAQAIYRALKLNKEALVDGMPIKGERTLIDGTFDLIKTATKILAEIDKMDAKNNAQDRATVAPSI